MRKLIEIFEWTCTSADVVAAVAEASGPRCRSRVHGCDRQSLRCGRRLCVLFPVSFGGVHEEENGEMDHEQMESFVVCFVPGIFFKWSFWISEENSILEGSVWVGITNTTVAGWLTAKIETFADESLRFPLFKIFIQIPCRGPCQSGLKMGGYISEKKWI